MFKALRFAFFAAAAVAVFGFVVISLWNWLMQALFGWHALSFGQALGLLILSRILFGSFGGRGRHSYARRRMRERWERMSPEEREKFRAGMRHGCGHLAGSGRETTT